MSEYDKKYYRAHRKQKIEKVMRWAKENPGKHAETSKRHYQNHRKEIIAKVAAYRLTHLKQIKDYQKRKNDSWCIL